MKNKINEAKKSFKNINWRLISDGAIIFGMIAILIGFVYLTSKIYEIKKDINELKVIYEIKDELFDKYEIDSEIKIN